METLAARTIGQELAQMAPSDRRTENRNCEEHGGYVSRHFSFGKGFWSPCPVCEGARLEAQAKADSEKAAQERRDIGMRNAMRRAAIPPRFADRRFSNFDVTCEGAGKALATVQQYADDFKATLDAGRSLILVGNVGAGKTHLATSAAHRVIELGYSAVFSSVMEAVRSVKETYRRGSERTERDAIDALIDPDLLILDEVGVQFGSDAEKLILFEIINGRYENVRPTIIISNLDMEGLKSHLGDRVVDRLREGGGKLVVFDWPSHRRAA